MSGVISTSILGFILIGLGFVMCMGKASIFIAGYNTLSQEEKKMYDKKKLTKFVGKLLLCLGVLTPFISIGFKVGYPMISFISIALIIISVVIAAIYANSASRFKIQ